MWYLGKVTAFRHVAAALTGLLAVGVVSAEEVQEAEDVAALPVVEVQGKAPSGDVLLSDAPVATSKSSVPLAKQPYAATVIGKDFFEDIGAKNIQDALMYSSGVYAGAFGFDTRGDWAKVRGLDASFYQDGLRSIYGSYNSVRPNVFALEQVEVLKGPSSVLYGQAELGGIINSVSKLPKAQQEGEVWLQLGSHDRQQLAADVTGPLSDDGKLLYRLVALTRDSGTQVDYVDDDGMLFAPAITWLPTDNTEITLLVNSQRNTGAVSAQFLPSQGTIDPGPLGPIDPSTFVGEPGFDRYDREKNEITLFANQRLNDAWKLAFTARRTRSETETREHWADVGAVPDASGNISRTLYMADRGTRVTNVDLRVEGDVQLGRTQHNVVLGVDRQDARWEEDNYYYGYGQGGTINLYNPVYGTVNYAALAPADRDDSEISQTGFYLMDHIEMGSWVVSGALRHDNSISRVLAVSGDDERSHDKEVSGRAGVMYQTRWGLSPYLSYSEAFVPNLELDGNGNSLDASTGEQEEVGFKYVRQDLGLTVTGAYFVIEETNRVVQGMQPQSVEQVGAVSEGWELEVKQRWKQLEVQASFTDMNANNDATGERLPFTAERLASLWGQYQLTNGLRVGAGVRYIGSNMGYDYGSGANPKVPSVTLYDAMLGYQVDNWDFSVNMQNLSDKEYVSWCRGPGYDCGYGELRSVMANARYRF